MRRWITTAVLAACGGPPQTGVTPAAPAVEQRAAPAPQVARHTDYPATRREAVADELHGVRVADPYRWLEDPSKPEVQAWRTAQDGYARDRLAKLPGRGAIAARLRELFYYDARGTPTRRNGRLFYGRKHKDEEKETVCWRQGDAGAEQILLDPNTWSADGSTGLRGWAVSRDGTYVAYAVSEHNADETVTRVIEVATGNVQPDTVTGTKHGAPSWSPDNRGFYYTFTPPASATLAEADRNARSELRYHVLGTPAARDAIVHEATGRRDWLLDGSISEDGHWLFATIRHGSSGAISWFYKDARKPQRGWTTLIDGVDATTNVVDWHDTFYVHTNDGAPRYHVFAVNPARPARAAWKEIVPEQDATMEAIAVLGGRLVVNMLRSAASEMEIRSLDGTLVHELALPALGTVSEVTGLPGDDTAYVSYTSFTEAGIAFRVSIKSGTITEWARIQLPFDAAQLVVEQVRYTSKDGTQIPMFLVHRKDALKTGTAPTLLTGYGGFQISATPSFSGTHAAFVERGGLLAVPSLRGGGEFGEAWHRGGMLANKQNVFDDFIAAAHYLIDEHWTSSNKLAISGDSNGGLLVGAAMVQAPALFQAVVCGVPVLDMIRYHKFGPAAAWISELGVAEDATQFQALYAYSPYHHVRDGVSYPALLTLSADHDDRVDPMHARKFTAALQAATTGPRPVWLRIEQNAGHGGADAVKQQVEQNADALAFVMAQLGVEPN